MENNAKIFVAGHRGLVGSAILNTLKQQGYTNLITRTHQELDLTDQAAVAAFFAAEKPDYVFLAAAKVGGIHANNIYPAEFIYDNLAIQMNVIHNSWKNGVKRLLFLGSSCIYPKMAPQPMKETHLLTGALEPSNRPYALAKIAGIEQCWSYNRQYGTQFLAVMPTNLYGPGDNYHAENSHVIPGLIRRFCEAKDRNDSRIAIWGTGKVRREFLHSSDLASACVFLLKLPDDQFKSLLGNWTRETQESLPLLLNVGVGSDITIAELAELIKEITGFAGTIEYDTSKPEGTPRKLLDVSRMQGLGWNPSVSLREGLTLAVEEFRHNASLRR